LFFAVVLTLGIFSFELAFTESKIAQNQAKAVQALYVAEAGIQIAVNQLKANPAWEGSYKNIDFEPGKIKVITVTNKGNNPQVRIESQGEVDGINRRIRVDLKKERQPFNNAVTVDFLHLKSYTSLNIKGGLIVSDNLIFPPSSSLEGRVEVDGQVILNDAVFGGSLSASESIVVNGDTIINGLLVAAKEIICKGVWQKSENCFPYYQGINGNKVPALDFDWYLNNKHEVLTETTVDVSKLNSGIYFSAGDLVVTADSITESYNGKIAIVSEGAITLIENLTPQDSREDALLIIAKNILVDSQVNRLWAGLIAKKSFTVQEGGRGLDLFGGLQAGSVDLPAGTFNFQFHTLPGENLVKLPQLTFKLVDWLEIVVL